AVRERIEAIRILAALAAVRLPSDAVHREGERLVSLEREGAEAHGPRREAPDDGGGRFDLLERDGRSFAEAEKAPDRGPPLRALVRDPRVFAVGLPACRLRGVAHGCHRVRVPHPLFAPGPPVVLPGVCELPEADIGRRGPGLLVPAKGLLPEIAEAGALQAARRAGKAAVHHLGPDPDRLEDLGAPIARQAGDP